MSDADPSGSPRRFTATRDDWVSQRAYPAPCLVPIRTCSLFRADGVHSWHAAFQNLLRERIGIQ
jgi:hypothetical protein